MPSFISREQDYALRITSYLAGEEEGKPVPISWIADKVYISKQFAANIAHTLKKAGILESVQGVHGGVFLKKKAKDLSVFDIISSFGFKLRMNKCLSSEFHCDLEKGCQFHRYFSQLENLLIENFKSKHLSDFVADTRRSNYC